MSVLSLFCLLLSSILTCRAQRDNAKVIASFTIENEGFNNSYLSLSTNDDILTLTRQACNQGGLDALDCCGVLEAVMDFVKAFLEEEGDESPLVKELLTGSSTNSILLRNAELDDLSKAVRATLNATNAEYAASRPLNIYVPTDRTNSLGDKWATYLFVHYARKLDFRRAIKVVTNLKDAFATSAGSTLQRLFHEEKDRLNTSPNTVLDHKESGLRTSIGNGLISEAAEQKIYDDAMLDIVGVRGPLTRAVLSKVLNRVPPVISDPCLLAPRLYPLERPSPPLRRPVGFIVHESHRVQFRKIFPEFQDCIVDDHIALNARSFFEHLLAYEVLVSSSLHGIVFAHAYGINVLPVTFVAETDSSYMRNGEKAPDADFEYIDYYRSVGHYSFARRNPLLTTTFDTAQTREEKIQRIVNMANNYWQPTNDTVTAFQDTQEALLIDYLKLYERDYDVALPSSYGQKCSDATTAVRKGVGARPPALIQEYLLWHALAELFLVECPLTCLTQISFSAYSHEYARNVVNGREMGLVFPRKLVDRVRNLADALGKSLDFNFMGLITPERAWVYAFDVHSQPTAEEEKNEAVQEHSRTSVVRQSLKGRNHRKYLFDYEYFNILATSRFTLCPVGDYHWSYRFLEAIMAMSIPILSTSEAVDIHAKAGGFFYYKYTPPPEDSSKEMYQLAHDAQVRTFIYSREIAEANYQKLLSYHVISKEMASNLRDSTEC